MTKFQRLMSLVVFLPILLISNYLTFSIVVNFITNWSGSLFRQVLIATTSSVCLSLNLVLSAGLIYAMVKGGDDDE